MNTTDKKCCEDCISKRETSSDGMAMRCMYPSCPCHTQNTTDTGWEERFDKEIGPSSKAVDYFFSPKIKDFIRREIQQKGEEEYARGKKELSDVLRETLKERRRDIQDNSDEEEQERERLLTLQMAEDLVEAALTQQKQ